MLALPFDLAQALTLFAGLLLLAGTVAVFAGHGHSLIARLRKASGEQANLARGPRIRAAGLALLLWGVMILMVQAL